MKKIGIVTFNDAYNYGAFLQEYALQTFLIEKGYVVNVLNYNNSEFAQLYTYSNNVIKRKGIKNKLKIIFNIVFRMPVYKARLEKQKMFENCNSQEIRLSRPFDEIKDTVNEQYDMFISGSDQVWNIRMTGYNLYYLLDFVEDTNKKISYAASFGRTNFDGKDYEIFKKFIGSFSKVLVREQSGKELLHNKCEVDSEVVLDPTFLLDNKQWKEFSEKSRRQINKDKYVLIYIVSKPKYLYQAAIKYAQENNYKIILLGRNSDISINGITLKASVDVGPYEFIDYLLNAEAVFTTSFHGTILSINNNIDFYYELAKETINNNARLEDIINLVGLKNREIISSEVKKSIIDWENVNLIINAERTKSEDLLIRAIENKERN